jgi:hypothetical protein
MGVNLMNPADYPPSLFDSNGRHEPLPHQEQRLVGEMDAVFSRLPAFNRQGLAVVGGTENPFLDVITRESPAEDCVPSMPVGVVSKKYRLLPHAEIAAELRSALIDNKIDPEEVRAEAQLSAFGARMALFLQLPRRFDFDPGDGFPMALRILCFNSVDGSSKLRVLLGWYRFVCANGMAVGTTQYECRALHREDAGPLEIAALLKAGINAAEREKFALMNWLKVQVNVPAMVAFADGALAKAWGVRAAARFLHIATTGFDADIAQPFEPGLAHTKTMTPTRRVPGSPVVATTAYQACQALTWIARGRRDPLIGADWMLQVPTLMKSLLKSGSATRTTGT